MSCVSQKEDLNKLGQWENEWCMKFHPDKCNVLRVTNKTKKTEANYHLHGHTLELVTSAKYLSEVYDGIISKESDFGG
jgi:hypothetical protein